MLKNIIVTAIFLLAGGPADFCAEESVFLPAGVKTTKIAVSFSNGFF
jgi:hypothetical protein